MGADFVEVMYAKSLDEADRLCALLQQKSIPATIEQDPVLPTQCGVAVLVPSEKLVQASQVLTLMAHDDEDDEDFEFDDDEDEDLDDFDDDEDDYDDDDDIDDDDDDIPDDDEEE